MSHLKKIISAVCLTAAALASAGAQASIAAPDFLETINVSLINATGTIDSGWKTTGRIYALGANSFGGNNMPGALPKGTAGAISAVNWSGNCPGYTCAGWQTSYLTQEVTGLAVGAEYTVSFSQAAFNNVWTSTWAPIGWGQNSRWWEVSLGSQSQNSTAILPNIITSQATNYTQAHTNWLSQTMTFTATATTETLRFLAKGNVGDPEYLYLDNLTITNMSVVPEPATYVLMAFGLVAIGLFVRGRRRS